MYKYTTKKGKFIGNAWSAANRCNNPEPHPPHVYNSHFYSYGPYLCKGNKKVIIEWNGYHSRSV